MKFIKSLLVAAAISVGSVAYAVGEPIVQNHDSDIKLGFVFCNYQKGMFLPAPDGCKMGDEGDYKFYNWMDYTSLITGIKNPQITRLEYDAKNRNTVIYFYYRKSDQASSNK